MYCKTGILNILDYYPQINISNIYNCNLWLLHFMTLPLSKNLYPGRWISMLYIISNIVHDYVLNKTFTILKVIKGVLWTDQLFQTQEWAETVRHWLPIDLQRSTVRGNEQSWEERKGKKSKTKSNQVLTVSEWEKY